MGRLRVMDRSGDTTVTWGVDEKEAVKEAERIFKEQISKGATAISVVDGGNSVVLSKFDPEAQEIVMVPRIAGG